MSAPTLYKRLRNKTVSLTSNTIHATSEMEPEMPERASNGFNDVVEDSLAIVAVARKP